MSGKTNLKTGAGLRRVHALVLRPGLGWSHLGGAVYGHTSGVRVHLSGMIRTINGKHYSLNSCVGGLGWHLIAINGGNRKRGLMAWALNSIPQNVWCEPRGKQTLT